MKKEDVINIVNSKIQEIFDKNENGLYGCGNECLIKILKHVKEKIIRGIEAAEEEN